MATANDVIKRALRRIRVLGVGEDPDGDDALVCLEALNDEMHKWAAEDIAYTHTTLSSPSSTFPLDDDHIGHTAAILAVRVADDFGANVTQKLKDDADDGWQQIMAAYWPDTKAIVDETLIYLPSRRYVSDLISE